MTKKLNQQSKNMLEDEQKLHRESAVDEQLLEFNRKFIAAQEPLEPEFEKVFWDNYWDLLA